MSAYVLSPLAPPFEPSCSNPHDQNLYVDSIEFAIYNDGVPSLTRVGGRGGDIEVIDGISDEAIEELFPPTAEEVAEIEAVEMFVEVMAKLSILEESEEKARRDFGHIKKRWEKRREEGLKGRPKPAKSLVETKLHSSVTNEKETCLVSSGHFERLRDLESRIRAKEAKRHATNPKNVKGSHGFSKPIHQPRKHS